MNIVRKCKFCPKIALPICILDIKRYRARKTKILIGAQASSENLVMDRFLSQDFKNLICVSRFHAFVFLQTLFFSRKNQGSALRSQFNGIPVPIPNFREWDPKDLLGLWGIEFEIFWDGDWDSFFLKLGPLGKNYLKMLCGKAKRRNKRIQIKCYFIKYIFQNVVCTKMLF